MAVVEVDKDQIMELFELKQNVKNTVLAVIDNRLTAAHLSSDVFALIEVIEKLEVAVVGEPVIQEVPQAVEPQAPAQEGQAPPPPEQQEAEPAPEEQAPTEPQQDQG